MNRYYQWWHRLVKRQEQGLIISEMGAGETALLDQAGFIPFDYSKSDPLLNDQPKHTLTRWRYGCADCLSLTLPKSGKETQALLTSLADANIPPITFVILCLDVSRIDTHRATSVSSVLNTLTKTAQQTLPFYVFLTHSDKLHGFESYAYHLNETDRSTPWGLVFDGFPTAHAWLAASTRFLSTVQRRCLAKLHVTHLQSRREALMRFPLSLEETFKQVYALLDTYRQTHPQLQFKGLYLSSNPPDKPAFFTINLMNNLLSSFHTPSASLQPTQRAQSTSAWSTGIAAVALLIGSTMAVSYYRLVKTAEQQLTPLINPPPAFLAKPPHPSPTPGNKPSMIRLKQWQQAITSVSQYQPLFSLTALRQLTQRLEKTQKARLNTVWLPYLDHRIVKKLQALHSVSHQPTWKQALMHYRYLQAYVLLHSPNRLAHRQQLQAVIIDEDQSHRQLLTDYFEQLLSLPPQPASPEITSAIDAAQRALRHYSAASLITALAVHAIQSASPEIKTNIQSIYTKDNAKRMETQIKQSAHDLAQGKNPVIGPSIPIQPSAIDKARRDYFKAYRHYWEKQLQQLTVDAMAHRLSANPSSANTLKMATDLLHAIINPQSALYQQLNAILQHVSPQPNRPAFNQHVSQHFKGLKLFLSDLKTHHTSYQRIDAAYRYLADSGYQPDTALAMAKTHIKQHNDPLTRLHHQAAQLPAPFHLWLDDIETLAFRGLLTLSRVAMNKAWKTSVWQPYQSQLAGRYPLFKRGHHDVTLKAFTRFFGPNGRLHRFYQHYMQPFIDQKAFYWVWKDVDGSHLPIPQTVLELFMRGELIRKMYFPDGQSYPIAHFTLTPAALAPTVHQMRLTIGNQHMIASPQNNAQSLSFSWPNLTPPEIKLMLLDNANNMITLTETGLWAWFKFLDKGVLKPTEALTHYTFSIQSNGLSADYRITSDKKLNPLALDIIAGFRCPKTL